MLMTILAAAVVIAGLTILSFAICWICERGADLAFRALVWAVNMNAALEAQWRRPLDKRKKRRQSHKLRGGAAW